MRQGIGAIGAAAVLACALAPLAAAQPQPPRVDGRLEALAALHKARATEAAIDRMPDEDLRQARAQIETLRALGPRAQTQLIAAQEGHLQSLADRDHTYAKEIAALAEAVQRITETPEGAAALVRFNAGDEAGALAALDQTHAARRQAETLANADIAADRRMAAALAREARARGKLDTNAVIARYEEVTRLDPGAFWDWLILAELYRDAGRLAYARRAGERAMTLARADHERAAAAYEIGAVLAMQRDFAGARRRYEESLAVERRLAATDEGPHAGRGVADLQARIGDALIAQGDFTGARVRYEESRAIARALTDVNPGSVVLRRDYFAAGLKVADAMTGQREYAAAQRLYEDSLAIGRRLAEAEGDRARGERDAAAILDRIGEVLISRGELRPAQDRLAVRLALLRRIAETGRTPAAQRDVFACAMRLGDVLVALGDLANARARYEEALVVAQRLAEAERSAAARRDLALNLMKLGDVLVGQGFPVLAHERLDEGFRVARDLFAQEPNSAAAEQDLALVQFHLGELEMLMGRAEDARARFRQAVAVFRTLSQRSGADPQLRWALLGAEFRLAQSLDDPRGVGLAIDRLRALNGLETRPFRGRWVNELRSLARLEDPH
jgi:tetratricopeptide (TPR) repeat protein